MLAWIFTLVSGTANACALGKGCTRRCKTRNARDPQKLPCRLARNARGEPGVMLLSPLAKA